MTTSMIGLVITIFGAQQAPDVGPFSQICLAAATSTSPLVIADVRQLREQWRSKTPVVLKSGNLGVYSNGTYFILSKDLPILKSLRDKFNLAKKILQLASDGRAKLAEIHANGSEFSLDELKTLSKELDRWTGNYLTAEELNSQKPFLFYFDYGISFSNGGESYTISPTVHYPSPETLKFVEDNSLKAGILAEPSESRHKENFTKHADDRYAGSEATDGNMSIRFFNVMADKPDYLGAQRTLSDIVEKLYQDQSREYRVEIAKLSAPVRKMQEYMYPNFDLVGPSEAEAGSHRTALMALMTKNGYSSQTAESRVGKLQFTGRDIMISLQTVIQIYGQKPMNFAATVRIWP